MQRIAGWSLLEELSATQELSRMDDTAISQPALFAVQVGCVRVLSSLGCQPAAVIGHSVGEVAAAHIAGVLSLEDAIRVIYHRGRTMAAAPGGRMLAVGVTQETALELLAPHSGSAELAAVNAPDSVTLAGDEAALQEIADGLSDDIFCRFLPVKYAFHSHHMDPVRDDLLSSLAGISTKPAQIDIASSVRGDAAEPEDFNAEYWWHNVRKPVRFSDGISALIGAGYEIFLEISPHPVLTTSIKQNLQHHASAGLVLSSLKRDACSRAALIDVIGQLYCAGYPIDWQKVWPGTVPRLALPLTPWNRKTYWHEPASSREFRCGTVLHPLLERSIGSTDPAWQTALKLKAHAYLSDHRVQGMCVFPGAAYVEMAIRAGQSALDTPMVTLRDLHFEKAVFVPESDGDLQLLLKCTTRDNSFEICSQDLSRDDAWSLNVRGYMDSDERSEPRPALDLSTLGVDVLEHIESDRCYEHFESVGLNYGDAFRGVRRIDKYAGYAIGSVELPASAQLIDADKYWLNPALLDACFQVILGMISDCPDRPNSLLQAPLQQRHCEGHPSTYR